MSLLDSLPALCQDPSCSLTESHKGRTPRTSRWVTRVQPHRQDKVPGPRQRTGPLGTGAPARGFAREENSHDDTAHHTYHKTCTKQKFKKQHKQIFENCLMHLSLADSAVDCGAPGKLRLVVDACPWTGRPSGWACVPVSPRPGAGGLGPQGLRGSAVGPV